MSMWGWFVFLAIAAAQGVVDLVSLELHGPAWAVWVADGCMWSIWMAMVWWAASTADRRAKRRLAQVLASSARAADAHERERLAPYSQVSAASSEPGTIPP